mmetsp:Transcript_12965/g.29123  ORF Transcript_12965/g.29123 Transcript_12965/m.29123 type:complete len:209 (-) Transcript_12965:178-804(-)
MGTLGTRARQPRLTAFTSEGRKLSKGCSRSCLRRMGWPRPTPSTSLGAPRAGGGRCSTLTMRLRWSLLASPSLASSTLLCGSNNSRWNLPRCLSQSRPQRSCSCPTAIRDWGRCAGRSTRPSSGSASTDSSGRRHWSSDSSCPRRNGTLSSLGTTSGTDRPTTTDPRRAQWRSSEARCRLRWRLSTLRKQLRSPSAATGTARRRGTRS